MHHLYGTTTFEGGAMAYKRLTERERYQIEALKREGFTQSAIARSLGRSRSTINREIGRNSDAFTHWKAQGVKHQDQHGWQRKLERQRTQREV